MYYELALCNLIQTISSYYEQIVSKDFRSLQINSVLVRTKYFAKQKLKTICSVCKEFTVQASYKVKGPLWGGSWARLWGATRSVDGPKAVLGRS